MALATTPGRGCLPTSAAVAANPMRRGIARSVYLARRSIVCAAVRPLRAVCATLQRRRRSAKSRGSAGDCGRAARALVIGRNGRTRARAYMECEILRPPYNRVRCLSCGRPAAHAFQRTPFRRRPVARRCSAYKRYNRSLFNATTVFKKTRPIARMRTLTRRYARTHARLHARVPPRACFLRSLESACSARRARLIGVCSAALSARVRRASRRRRTSSTRTTRSCPRRARR